MNNNSKDTTPLKNQNDDNHSYNHGLIYYQCQGEYIGTSKCTVCTSREQCIKESKKWW